MVVEGQKAPEFCLKGIDEEGNERQFCLKDFLHEKRFLVLYFYPKDNTPGCTQQACDLRDNMNRLKDFATVVGVSPDSINSHKNFQKKHGLNFVLLSDPNKEVLKAYGAWGKKKMYGKVREGVIRTTFIIDSQAIVKRVWTNVKVKGHVDELINALVSFKP